MKFQPMFVFLIASLTTGVYAQTPCTVSLIGQSTYKINGQSGCVRLGPTNLIGVARAANNVGFKLYNDVNCKGLMFTGSGVAAFNPQLRIKSVELIC
ncbi:3103_t:CDS:2 [Paraglomus occultum]|uniref:3103_t:CDS:1 n=1 Tax=Paraglomus occultum TaxID=144539 RepID=A0A9N9CWL4_9GLOM|nr:3103_t:CDS:2 [Paraglomus occultum]